MTEPSTRAILEQSPKQTREQPVVLVTSTGPWPFTAQLAIGLAQAGIGVSVLCPPSHPLLKTRAVTRVFHYGSFRPVRSLLDAIRATSPQLVIPCDDRAVDHVHELYADAQLRGTYLDALIERSLGHPSSYSIVSSRRRLLEVAREEGIRVPETKPIRTIAECDDLDETKFPWVLKADGTWGGRGVSIAENRAEAKEVFQQLGRVFGLTRALKRAVVDRDLFWSRRGRRSRPSVIAQTYIRGVPANCAAICWRGQVLAGSTVEVLSTEGITKPATVVRVVDNPEMMLAMARIARRLGLSGFFGLDFMIEEDSGTPYLIEMNPRCTPLSHLRLGKGRDQIAALAEELSGQRQPDAPPVTEKDIIAYFPQALQQQSELLESSFLDIPQDEPELIEELLRPSFGRRLAARLESVRNRRPACDRVTARES